MNDKFDELAKGMAQSVTRRGALKKFGIGVAGVILASLGFASNAQAGPHKFHCRCNKSGFGCTTQDLCSCLHRYLSPEGLNDSVGGKARAKGRL